MGTQIDPTKSTNTDVKLEALTEEKKTLSNKLVDKAEKLHHKSEDLLVTTKKKRTVKQKLVNKAAKLNDKAEDLVVSAKEKKSVDDNLVKTAEKLSQKTEDLERTNKFMVGRELKMIEQKKEIAELKKSQ